jgi:predicted amino acid-binding ACT domain protein
VATAAELTSMLAASGVPPDATARLVDGLAGMWLLNEPAEALAADLVHCHPAPSPGEVRAGFRPSSAAADRSWRLTVVAPDRPGLLAATAGTLASHGLSVKAAGLTTWPEEAMALQGLTVDGEADWDELADEIRDVLQGQRPTSVAWKPEGPVKVVSSPVLTGQNLITVEAPDRVGLLWAVASWFAAQGLNVEAAQLDEQGERAVDRFLIDSSPDVNALATHLAGTRRRFPWVRKPGRAYHQPRAPEGS